MTKCWLPPKTFYGSPFHGAADLHPSEHGLKAPGSPNRVCFCGSVDLELSPRSVLRKHWGSRSGNPFLGTTTPKKKVRVTYKAFEIVYITSLWSYLSIGVTHSSLTHICPLPSELRLAVVLYYSNKISVHTASSIYNALPIILLPSRQTSTHSSRLWSNAVSPVKTSPIFPGGKIRHFLFWSQNKIYIKLCLVTDIN